MLSRHLRQKSLNNKFNACKVQKNMFLPLELSKQLTEYELEDKISVSNLGRAFGTQPQQPYKQNSSQSITYGKNQKTVGNDENSKRRQLEEEEEVEDFTDAWNYLQQSQMEKKQQEKIQKQQKKSQTEEERSSQSSLQLTEQQMRRWVFSFQNSEQRSYIDVEPSVKRVLVENFSDEQNSVSHPQSNQVEEEEDFFILDHPFCLKGQKQSALSFAQNGLQKQKKYGPWQFSTSTYGIYTQWELKLVHQISSLWGTAVKNEYQKSSAQPLQKINWEIQEEKKPEVKGTKSKRNCRTKVIEYGKDFLIFDHTEFLLYPIPEQAHIYFGLRALGQQETFRQGKPCLVGQCERQLKEYLYLTSSGECLLQAHYPNLSKKEVNWKELKQFKVRLAITGQILATCRRKIYDEDKDKKEVIEIRKYDVFEKKELQFLGVIESKISSFNHQWYCDTTINVPRKKCFTNKPGPKHWEKFKIELKVSQTGNIVAELGIFDAQSSVTNCILFGQTKSSQFMMGTIMQEDDEVNYILRIAGLSPLVGFVTALSRKIFVLSS